MKYGGIMAFCPSCGATVEGKFCGKCGSAVAAAPPPGPAPGAYVPPQQGGYAPPPQQGGYTPPQPGYAPPPPGGYAPPPQGAYAPPPPANAAAGLQQNVACALCYLLGLITGVLFLVLEPYNKDKTIRFHAFQSIFAHVAVIALYIVMSIFFSLFIRILGLWTLATLLSLVFDLVYLGIAVGWVFLMYKAYNNQRLVIPIIGPLAEKQA